MRRRQKKGLFVVIVIIVFCFLFLFFAERNADKKAGIGGVPVSNEVNLIQHDIFIRDTFESQEESVVEQGLDELSYMMNHFYYVRSSDQLMLIVMACIVVLYLIVVGPVAYFYLKRIGKMERMWMLLPLTALLFGCSVFMLANDFDIKEPLMDVLRVDSPGRKSVCYAVSTSPGEDRYRITFGETVESLQAFYIEHEYEMDDETRALILDPPYAFAKDYFQYGCTTVCNERFTFLVGEQEEGLAGNFTNGTEWTFSKVMLCYQNKYCIVSSVEAGARFAVTPDMWMEERIGMENNIQEDLRLYSGINKDEEHIFDFAWHRHLNDNPEGIHIAGIRKDCETGVKETGVDMISYGLFYQ